MQPPMTGLWVLLFGLLVWLAAAWADTLTVTVSRANVRQGPGLTHGVIATLPRGATFPILSTHNGWRQIQLDDGRHAWIADSVVRVESSDPSERALERRPEPASQRRVALVRDASQRQMQDAVRAFGRRLAQGGAGLFYYAGHGLQVAGQNYLVPIGADIIAEFDVEHEAVSAGWILSAMDYAGNGLNLVILDACRNNPYSRSFRGGSAEGLAAPTQTAKGSLIAYATSPNAVAAERERREAAAEAERQRREREAQERTRREAEARRKLEKLRLVMVRVDGGSFIIGCQSGRDGDCYNDEAPPHRVRVRSFEIGKYEVAQALSCLGAWAMAHHDVERGACRRWPAGAHGGLRVP